MVDGPAARAIGLARGALEDAMAYAQERKQFGRPISEFQAIRFKIADMAAEIEADLARAESGRAAAKPRGATPRGSGGSSSGGSSSGDDEDDEDDEEVEEGE